MSADVLVPLGVFFALTVPTLVIVWRIFVVGAELRRDAQSGRVAMDIARRTDISLGELSPIVDDLRRGKVGPETSEANLRAGADALRRYAQEAELVDRHVPRDTAGLGSEIARAQRALELIEYGRALMLDRTGEQGPQGETAVKRGYLNLLHARDAIKARAAEIAAAAAAPVGKDRRQGVRGR